MLSYTKGYPSVAFGVNHKIDQGIFNWELLVTDNAQSISRHMLLLKIFLYSLGVALNVHEKLSVG